MFPIPVADHHIFLEKKGMILALWYIREHGPITLKNLSDSLCKETQAKGVISVHLVKAIAELEKSGLIKAENMLYDEYGFPKPDNIENVLLTTLPRLMYIQSMFGIKITDYLIPETEKNEGGKSPIFGQPMPYDEKQWADIFVLMPFDENLNFVYERHILSVAKNLSLNCKRGDDFFSSKSIIDEIWSAIYHSKLCIADCTNRNPNVFYEIGIAHTIGKPVILIAQSLSDIPFDVRHRRVIIYNTGKKGMSVFEEVLSKTIINEISGSE